MHMDVSGSRKAAHGAGIVAAVMFCNSAAASTMGLTDVPLFLSAGAQPNLIMAIDDSSSMDFEVLLPGNDGAAWWRSGHSNGCQAIDMNKFTGCVVDGTGAGDVPSPGKLNFNNSGHADGRWKKYSYLFPNGRGGDTGARRRLSDADHDHFAIAPIAELAWARSPTYNAAYFNPLVTYEPWVNGGGYVFNDANPAATRFDPVFESTATVDLTQDYAGVGNAHPATACTGLNNAVSDDYLFKVYSGMTLPAGTCFRSAPYATSAGDPQQLDPAPQWQYVRAGESCRVGIANGCRTTAASGTRDFTLPSEGRLAIRYFPATFWLPATAQLPQSYGYVGIRSGGGKAPTDNTTGSLVGYSIKPANFATPAQYHRAMQNFANWFQYYRKRHQALRAALGESFSHISGLRVDGFTINARNASVTLGSLDSQSVKSSLYSRFYSDWVRSGATPNRSAVATIIDNFRRTDSAAPVTLACQKNFGLLFTDGFSDAPADNDGIRGVYGNVDGSHGTPYSDTYSGSLADAVMDAYLRPLRTGANFPPGKVMVPSGCGTGAYSGPLDCNRDLHMNFYAVTLGTRGLVFDPEAVPRIDPYRSAPAWPTAFPARHLSAIDDLWHATINGRGQLLNAREPRDIATQLQTALRSIVERTSSAAAATLSSGVISSRSVLYQARFRSADWTGQLLSYSVDPSNGQPIASSVRDAADHLPANRRIFTRNSLGRAVPFTWTGNLANDSVRVEQLAPAAMFTSAADQQIEGARMLDYLRGSDAEEGTSAGQYRVRRDPEGPNKLGDIVNSVPLWVGAPPFRYPDGFEPDSYRVFQSRQANRPGVIYVGANDGMLHAFHADGDRRGTEMFAYIPGAVFPRLRHLASPAYGHQFYVDGSPSMGDAYFAPGGRGPKAWRTVVAGGLNKGGQAIYAIDVTEPAQFGEQSLLWEFTDAEDHDLGFTFSQPVIQRMRDGKWYVIFGNGYNSMQSDGRASLTGSAVLYLVELETGVAIRLDTGAGFIANGAVPHGNGLSTPAVVDSDGDHRADYAYAGDLYGNLWKFDLTAATPGSWHVAFGGQPLFSARDDDGNIQPITVRPEVVRGPGGDGRMILFGTGKYLETSDKLGGVQLVNSFYGIVDRDVQVTYSGLRTPELTKQSILDEVTATSNDSAGRPITSTVRISSGNSLGAARGWYLDLVSPRHGHQAEKQVTHPLVRDGKVIFTTLIPDSDPCGFGGSSWLMELTALDGSRPRDSPFDLNHDGAFDGNDRVAEANAGRGLVPSGLRSQDREYGILPAPVVATGELGPPGRGTPVQYKYLPGSSGTVLVVVENPGNSGTGRQSWREIR